MLKVGEITITPIFEVDASDVIREVITDATQEDIKAIDWLTPNYADKNGNIKAVNQSFLLQTQDQNILIDTGVGNGRPRPELLAWDDLDTGYLDNLKKVIKPEDIDLVICTHLHFDHIGWNTQLIKGRWQPTFHNATYVFSKSDYNYWIKNPKDELVDDLNGIEESIRPIVEAGQAKLVDDDEQITDQIRLIPTPGHTPHHVSVLVESNGDSALFAGDVFHHPSQIAHPEWMSFDTDESTALRSRKSLLETYTNTNTIIIGAHFSKPFGGHIVSSRGSYRLEPRLEN